MMGVIYAYSGTHGTGKTMAVKKLAEDYEWDGQDSWVSGALENLRFGVLHEVARECPFPVLGVECSWPSREAQLWIFSTQIQRELDLVRQYDLVIADRTVIDCIAYTIAFGYEDLAESMMDMARHHIHLYQKVIFREADKYNWCTDDGFRHQDSNLRSRIGEIMLDLYRQLDFDFASFPTIFPPRSKRFCR